jgi:hypothetical protein
MDQIGKQLECEWPAVGIKVVAKLLSDDEPELSSDLWSRLNTPLRAICRHPVSTGMEFSAEGRPPQHPVQTGIDAAPLGRKRWLTTRIKPGMISYSITGGYGGITIIYGKCTEPMFARGSLVAEIIQRDIPGLITAGKFVWHSQYITHEPVIMVVRRVN